MNELCIYDGDNDRGRRFGECCGSPWSAGQILTTTEEHAFLKLTGNEISLPNDYLITFDFKDIIGKTFEPFIITKNQLP